MIQLYNNERPYQYIKSTSTKIWENRVCLVTKGFLTLWHLRCDQKNEVREKGWATEKCRFGKVKSKRDQAREWAGEAGYDCAELQRNLMLV